MRNEGKREEERKMREIVSEEGRKDRERDKRGR